MVGRLGRSLMVATLGGLVACAPDDPFEFGGPRSCELADQNVWVHDLMQDVYLWAEHMPDVDPLAFESPAELVAALRYRELDRWSRVSDREQTQALFEEGKVIAFGMRTKQDADEALRLATVHADSSAGRAGLQRGDRVLSIAGLTVEEITERDLWGEIYGPNEPGITMDFEIESGGETRSLTLTKDWVTIETVPLSTVLPTVAGPVGYLLFTSFVETSFEQLDTAFAEFRAAGVRHVVVDMRYNGGGLISVARHLMNLLVGSKAGGDVAYQIQYSDTLSGNNSSRSLERADQSLDDVDHVVFLTTRSTLSASELVMNGVLPHTRISVVGSATGGKPVGARQWAFCDKVIAPITFKLLNANSEGDYFDGFDPDCPAADDLAQQLGSPAEATLAEALTLLETGSCTPSRDEPEPEPGEAEAPELRPLGARSAPRDLMPGAYPGVDALRGLY
jgi:carboxyl-terminal processing protease